MKIKNFKFILLGGALLGLGACTLNGQTNPLESASFREGRYEQMKKIQDFETCQVEALELDKQARARGSAGTYLASAKVLASCNRNLGTAAKGIQINRQMRLAALSITNYFRGGDVEQARISFEIFQQSYPSHDLYFADGSSFVETTEALLGRSQPMSYSTLR